MLTALDRIVVEVDKGIRTVFGAPSAERPPPGRDIPEAGLDEATRRHAAALMRVNHCGEVCAQALYQGQALASRDDELTLRLRSAAREEEDHLVWTESRIRELGGRTSLLNPLWYVGSLAVGYLAGKAGDAWSLAFLKETERQVERHLEGHLDRLEPDDRRTRAVVAQMRADEASHADMAARLGARELPFGVKRIMAAMAKLMTRLSFHI